MEERLFWTLIKANHRLGGNEYIHGRISGIQYIICQETDMVTGNMENDDGFILSIITTQNKYNKFAKIIEEMYPGLCTFDYMRDEK